MLEHSTRLESLMHLKCACICMYSECTLRSSTCVCRYSIFEVAVYVARNYPYVDNFLATCPYGDATIRNTLRVMTNATSRRTLLLELAVMVDVGTPLVRACYRVEGDGPVTLFAWETFQIVRNFLEAPPFVNVYRVLEAEFNCKESDLPPGSPKRVRWDALLDHARACVAPAFTYIARCERGELEPALAVLNAARLFNPYHIKGESFRAGHINAFLRDLCSHVPSLEAIRDDMLVEVSEYVILAKDTLPQNPPAPAPEGPPAHAGDDHAAMADLDILQWWRTPGRAAALPFLFAGLKVTLLLHPNSGGPERVFSLVNSYVSAHQQRMYDETLKTQLMLQYNRRPPATQNTRTSKSYQVTWEFIREFYAQQAAAVNR
jgi:hypothetical protein